MKTIPRSAAAPALELLPLRLNPGEDLRTALEALPRERDIAAAFVIAAVGSLSHARLRYAGKSDATLRRGKLEIIALSGTVSPDGAHLHAALADARGRVFGGHVLEGCIVRTTAEIVLGLAPAHRFARRFDPATGYRELVVESGRSRSKKTTR